MAEKDRATKEFLNNPDVFADVVNAVLFNGDTMITPDALTPVKVSSSIHRFTDDKHHEVIRDNAFVWKDSMIFVLLGIENQTSIENDMILRVMGYDGAAYQEQVVKYRAEHKMSCYHPVVTVVLNYTNRVWTAPKSLYEFFDLVGASSGGLHYSDYAVTVCDVAFQSESSLEKFKSDFKILAALLTATYCPSTDAARAIDGCSLTHEYELGRVVGAFSDDAEVKAVLQLWREDITMENPLRAYFPGSEEYERSRREAVERGRQEGRQEGVRESILGLMKTMNVSEQEARRMMGLAPATKTAGKTAVTELRYDK